MLSALQTALKKSGAEVSWTRPENIHLTIKFLGEVVEERLDVIVHASQSAASGSPPIELRLAEIGVFDVRRPRVVWVGLKGDLTLVQRLWSELDDRLSAVGFSRESRPFKPHLTIGRFKAPRRARELIAMADGYALPDVSFKAGEIVVVQSKLHPAGARYSILAKAPFKANL